MAKLFHPIYTIVNVAVCGRMSANDLAGFGLGSLTTGILAISIGSCIANSVGTLVSQSYGAGDSRMCRVYLNRQYYLNTWVYICVALPLLFVRNFYEAIGQRPEVADLAA